MKIELAPNQISPYILRIGFFVVVVVVVVVVKFKTTLLFQLL